MLHSLGQSARAATKLFRTFEEGQPDLVPTGLPPVDRILGGLGPGSAGILGAAQGVGKSSTVLSAVFNSSLRGIPVGYLSLEDTPDVLGSRAIAALTGINSLKIRTKNLSAEDKRRIKGVERQLDEMVVHVAYEVGTGLDASIKAIEELAKKGCRLVWIDYVQKIRGHAGDRRNEVSQTFSKLQGACFQANLAAMFVSQFSRQDPTKPPQISWLKESGDLENEARLIILMHRDDKMDLHGRICKSTFGGEGEVFTMRRDQSGTLREVTPELPEDF